MLFRYATIADIRAEGLTVAQMSDADVLRKLADAGEEINRLTGSFFIALYEQHIVAGRDSALLHHTKFVPIIRLDALYATDPGVVGNDPELIPSSVYAVSKRSVELKTPWQVQTMLTGRERAIVSQFYSKNRFDEGAGNYRMDGWFGDIPTKPDGTPEKEVTTAISTTALVAGAISIVVTSSSGFLVGDAVLIDKRFAAIITAIPDSTHLTIDAAEDSADIGDEVKSFGKVHQGIRKVAMILVFKNRYALGSPQAALATRRGRIIRERTDNYEYQLQAGGLTAGGYNSTGDEEADRILNQFVAPPYLGYA